MTAETFTLIGSLTALAGIAGGYLKTKSKANEALVELSEIKKDREETKTNRNEEYNSIKEKINKFDTDFIELKKDIQDIKIRLSITEKDCKQISNINLKIDKMNETLSSLKAMFELYMKMNNLKEQ